MIGNIVLIFTGVLGISFAVDDSIYCFSTTLANCNPDEIHLCAPTTGFLHCVNETAENCSMINDNDVKNLLNFTTNGICEFGTPVNQRYIKHWPCISSKKKSVDCYFGLLKAIAELRLKKLPSKEYFIESTKLGCKYNESVTTCVNAKVRKHCGTDAESLLIEFHNSGVYQLGRRLCDYVNEVGTNSVHLTTWILQVASIFITLKLFS